MLEQKLLRDQLDETSTKPLESLPAESGDKRISDTSTDVRGNESEDSSRGFIYYEFEKDESEKALVRAAKTKVRPFAQH